MNSHLKLLILRQIVLDLNIKFLISKLNKTSKIGPKMQWAGIAILTHAILLHKQTNNFYNQISTTSTAMDCIYSMPCFCSDSDDILNKFSCLAYAWL